MADENGSVDTGNPDAGTVATPGEGGGESVAANWTEGFDDDARSFVETKGWQGPQDVISSYKGLEKVLGNPDARVMVPGDDAKPEEWDAVYDRLGRPKEKDAYEFALPDGLPEGFAYSDELAGSMKEWAHAAGLNPRQAQTLHDSYVKHMAGAQQGHVESVQQAYNQTVGMLQKEWGQDYGAKTELALRAVETVGGDDLVRLMDETGMGNNPVVIKAMAKVAEMIGEDSLTGGGDGSISSAHSDIQSMQADAEFLKALTTREHPGHDAAVRRWSSAHDRAHGHEG